ncbi:MAG: transglutaminase domain-containing protein [Alkalispirochaeta sp.]
MLLVLGAGTLMWISQQPPRVDVIDPDSFVPGNTIAVEGDGFGESGRLAVDQLAIPRENIRRWTPNLIIFEVPSQIRSGLLRVTTSDGTSNPVFVTVEGDLPVPLRDRSMEVTRVEPETADVGSRIVVEGDGFGPRSAMAEIVFSSEQVQDHVRVGADHDMVLEWSNRRIELVLPHELPAGEFEIAINGAAADAVVTVTPPDGEPTVGAQRQLAVRTAVTVLTPADEVYAVLPGGLTFREQPQVQLIRENVDSRAAGDGATASYYLPPAEEPQRIDRVVLVARRAVNWSFNGTGSSEILLEPWFRTAYRRYLAGSEDLPRDNAVITDLRRGLELSEPVITIARTIHRTVMTTLTPSVHGTRDPVAAIETGEDAGSYAYATLAVALARSAGVPARRHFGMLLDDGGRSIPHAWVEFLVPGAGWIPADPAVGDGLIAEEIASLNEFYGDDRAAGTFGNLDDRRITLTIDGRQQPRLYPAGAMQEPSENWAPGSLRLETPQRPFPEEVEHQWEAPVLFGWFD